MGADSGTCFQQRAERAAKSRMCQAKRQDERGGGEPGQRSRRSAGQCKEEEERMRGFSRMKREGREFNSLAEVAECLPRFMRGTPLARFHNWLCKERSFVSPSTIADTGLNPPVDRQSTFESCLFPAHLPSRPPHLFQVRSPLSRRRAARLKLRRTCWLLAEWLWAALVFVNIGSPKTLSDYQRRLGVWTSSPRHEVALEQLSFDFRSTCCLQPLLAVARGRGTARLHKLQQNLAGLAGKIPVGSHLDLDAAEASAVPVRVEEVLKKIPE